MPTYKHVVERARNEKLGRILNFGLASPFSKGSKAKVKKGEKYDVNVGDKTIVSEIIAEKQQPKPAGNAKPKK